jgi:hypothetical protein
MPRATTKDDIRVALNIEQAIGDYLGNQPRPFDQVGMSTYDHSKARIAALRDLVARTPDD